MDDFRNFWKKIINEYPVFNENKNIKSHVYDSSNLLSKYCVSYMWPLILKGYNKPLEIYDLSLSPIKQQLISCYKKFLNNVVPNDSINDIYYFTFNVGKPLWKVNKKYVIISILSVIVNVLLKIAGVFVFRELVAFLYNNEEPIYMGILWALLICFTSLFGGFFLARTLFVNSDKAGIISRNLLMSLLHRKILKIPKYITDSDNITNGEILNIMSNDTERIFLGFRFGSTLFGSFINLFIGAGFMMYMVGWEGFLGLIILILAIPLQLKIV